MSKTSVSKTKSRRKITVDIVKYRTIWFGISLLVTSPRLDCRNHVLHAKFHAPLKPGIDFTGGSILQYQFEKPVTLESVHKVLDDCGFEGSQVQQATVGGQEAVIMRTKSIDQESHKRPSSTSKLDQRPRTIQIDFGRQSDGDNRTGTSFQWLARPLCHLCRYGRLYLLPIQI